MPVQEGYRKRTIEELSQLALIEFQLRHGGPIRPGSLGDRLFPESVGAVNCSCPYARIAGKVLRHMEKKDLIYHGRDGWILRGSLAESFDKNRRPNTNRE